MNPQFSVTISGESECPVHVKMFCGTKMHNMHAHQHVSHNENT